MMSTGVPPMGLERLAERNDMVSLDEAAALSGVPPSQLRRWASLKRPRVIALQHPRLGLRLPRWQFDSAIFPVVQQLGSLLGGDALTMLIWLETPLGAFQGLTPRSALEQGESLERVLKLAGFD